MLREGRLQCFGNCFAIAEDAALRSRLTECLETILNKAQEPPKSKKVQHSNAKNAVLFEAISLIIHHDRLVFLNLVQGDYPYRHFHVRR